jgi:hypothetical protein
MRELKARLQGLDAAPVPDLWPDAQQRTPRAQPEPPTRLGGTHVRRAVAILVATLVVLGAVLYGLSGLGSSTGGPAANPTDSDLASYVNPMGIPITLDYPSDWYAQSVSQDSNPDPSATGRQQIGVVISNVAEAMPSPGTAAPSPGPLPENPNLPQDYVSLSILYLADPCGSTGGCQPGLLRPNSSLPLSMSDAKVAPGPENLAILEATVAMHDLTIRLQAGPDASASDIAAADAIVASIRPSIDYANDVPSPQSVTVPDLVGMSVAEFKNLLEKEGLQYDISHESAADPAGTVSRQSPDPGTAVAIGTIVHLVISDGLPGNDLGGLDCPLEQQSAMVIYPPTKLVPNSATETLPDLVRRTFSGIDAGDQISVSSSEAGAQISISRSGATIARAFLTPHLADWMVAEVSSCAASGIEPPQGP